MDNNNQIVLSLFFCISSEDHGALGKTQKAEAHQGVQCVMVLSKSATSNVFSSVCPLSIINFYIFLLKILSEIEAP